MLEWISSHLVISGGILLFVFAAIAAVHALLFKEEVRAAIGWVGLILLSPLIGTVLYYFFGVNRIRRRAVDLRRKTVELNPPRALESVAPSDVAKMFNDNAEAAALSRLVGQITSRPLLPGNRFQPLRNGDEAYPAMIDAIQSAKRSISLLTYIFDSDTEGRQFIQALSEAHTRGVEVRVLIDAVGARYSRPPSHRLLRRAGVPVHLFLPTLLTRLPSFNLRNHRKIMVVDGQVGFTGGMNIRKDFVLSEEPRHPGVDLHFKVEGPVVSHLQQVFAEDWEFSTEESLSGEAWFSIVSPMGAGFARGVADGPDDDQDTLNLTLMGAISSARKSIRIVTPYFLPTSALVYALNAAALSGVQVDIVLPEKGNLHIVTWAMWAHLPLVLGHGCSVWLSPTKPFDHTKLMVVDDYWVLLGSTNWDPRSLRLNFEFNVESYDDVLAKEMNQLVGEKIVRARRLTLEETTKRRLPIRIRDGAARLLTPYL